MASLIERTWKHTALKLLRASESTMRVRAARCRAGLAPALGQSMPYTVDTHAARSSRLGVV